MSDSSKIRQLIDVLNQYTHAYDKGNPIITDTEWDRLYFELKRLEESTGIIFNDSPTQSIQYTIVNELEKVTHNHKMLSLDKTKSVDDISEFLGAQPFLMMLKMDGLTCSLTYQNGDLIAAETRGDGVIGENILHNAMVIPSIPKHIPEDGVVVIDGEIVCNKKDFEQFAEEYKNPRNFAAGSIRLLDAKECATRKLTFVAWDVIEGLEYEHCLGDRLQKIQHWGFTAVSRIFRTHNNKRLLETDINILKNQAGFDGWPIDGIVFKFDDVEYGRSLGETSHHFKNAIAYKFADDWYDTELIDIEWSMGRTGVLSPVAIFKPVDIDGSTVERASLHNISVMNETLGEQAHKWQKIKVFKANMIIPQIAWADKELHGPLYFMDRPFIQIPDTCPVCGGATEERTDIDSTVLICTNPACPGKLINRLDHFCGKKGLDIKGLSKATLEKLISWGWVNDFVDIFTLDTHRDEWIKRPGFGAKSVDNILNAIQVSQACELDKFIASLGIPLIGSTASKELKKAFKTWEAFQNAVHNNEYSFSSLPNFGYEMNYELKNFNYTTANYLVDNCILISSIENNNVENTVVPTQTLDGKTIVITGKLQYFKNRDALSEIIESHGGKVASSVSKNTSYLVNNDKNSTSTKNKSAQSLGIPIITENELLVLMNGTLIDN